MKNLKPIGSDSENWLYAYTKKNITHIIKAIYIYIINTLVVRMQQIIYS